MVIPLYKECDWAGVLQSSSPWSPPLKRTVVVAPHPDDESLGSGGLLSTLTAAGVDVLVIAVTDGENAYSDGVDLRTTRQGEQNSALARLGVSSENIHRLHQPDSGLHSVEEGLIRLLFPYVDHDTHLVAPWIHDFHPDHEVCGRAAQAVASRTGADLSSYLFWTYHRGSPSLLDRTNLFSLALSDSHQRAKFEAILCHKSQLSHPSGEPILPDDLLWPARLPFEVYIRS